MVKRTVRILVFAILTISIISCGLVQADMLEFSNKDSKKSNIITYENGLFMTEEGDSISRKELKSIYFSREEKVALEEKLPGEPEKIVPETPEEDIESYTQIADIMSEKYPDASGIIIYDVGRYTLTNDGQIKYWYHFVGKVLSTDTKAWADVSLYYEEGQSRARVIMGMSISPSGEISYLDTTTVKISEPSRGMAFFGKGKIYSFTVPDVEIGSIVDIIFETVEYAPEDPNLFAPRFFFQSMEPVHLSSLTIEIPADRNLNYITYNFPEYAKEPQINEGEESKFYNWQLNNVDPLVDEPNMPAYRNIAPGVFGCLYENMEYYYDKFSKFHSKRIEITPEIEAKVKEVTEGATTTKEKVAKLYYYIQRNIRYISVKGSLGSGIAGHPASYTFNNKYGDCIDKAILFASMLKALDVESYPIILATNDAGYIDRDTFPFWGGNHAINEVHIDGEKYILDATNNYFRFPYFSMGDCDIEYVNYIKRETNYIPPISPEDNAIIKNMKMDIDIEGRTKMETEMRFTGNWEAGYRAFLDYTPEGRHMEVFSNWLNNDTPGSTLDSFHFENLNDFSKQFVIKYKYTIDKHPVFAGDLMIFNVPGVPSKFPEIALEERNFGLKMDRTGLNSHNVIIQIPVDYKIEYLPPAFEVDNKYISYRASYEDKFDKIVFNDEFRRKTLKIPLEDYDNYKKDIEKIIAYWEKQIFLNKF